MLRPQRWLTPVVLALCATAHAQRPPLSVRVRAESRIELRTERGEGEVTVIGVLRDDLGGPLSGRDIDLTLRADFAAHRSHRVTTGPDGSFRWRLPLDSGDYKLTATFDGDDMHDQLDVEREINLAKAEVRLFVRLPSSTLSLDEPSHTVDVRALSAVGGDGLPVRLLDELERPLAEGMTDEQGQISFVVSSSSLGAPGPGRLRASTAGDTRRSAAQTEVPIIRERRTDLTLARDSDREVRVGESVRLHGVLRDSRGSIRERAVGIFVNDEHRGTVLTDENGEFRFAFNAAATDGESVVTQARFETDSPGLPSTSSPLVQIRIADAAPVGWLWALVPASLCVLVLILIQLRTKDRDSGVVKEPRPEPAGLVLARPKGRAPTATLIAGHITSHRRGRPLMAIVRARGPSQIDAQSDEGGRFKIELAAGEWELTFEARGYSPIAKRVQIPHRGEWDNIQVRMESWRERALGAFERVIGRGLPRSKWEKMTIRELSEASPKPPVRELGQDVEVLVYGPEAPGPEEVGAVEARADEILRP